MKIGETTESIRAVDSRLLELIFNYNKKRGWTVRSRRQYVSSLGVGRSLSRFADAFSFLPKLGYVVAFRCLLRADEVIWYAHLRCRASPRWKDNKFPGEKTEVPPA